jgi:hypothetical protein
VALAREIIPKDPTQHPLLTKQNTLYFGLVDAHHPQRYVQSRYDLGFRRRLCAEPGVALNVVSRGLSPVSARAEKPREHSSCFCRKGSGFVSNTF